MGKGIQKLITNNGIKIGVRLESDSLTSELFQCKYFKSLINITKKGKLLYKDNTSLKPKDFDIGDIIKRNNFDGGVSYTWSKDIVIPILGFNSQSSERITEKIIKTIEGGREDRKCI